MRSIHETKIKLSAWLHDFALRSAPPQNGKEAVVQKKRGKEACVCPKAEKILSPPSTPRVVRLQRFFCRYLCWNLLVDIGAIQFAVTKFLGTGSQVP
jgi:hypothetical protein